MLLHGLRLLPLLLWYVFSRVLIRLCFMLFDWLLRLNGRLIWKLVEHLRLSRGRLFWIHHLCLLCNDLFWLYKYLIVFVAVVISNFILIMSTLPFTINNKLVLMEPRCQFLAHCKCPIRKFGHREALLPFVERSYYFDILSTMPPHKKGWWNPYLSLWLRLLLGLLLFVNRLLSWLNVSVCSWLDWIVIKHLLDADLWRCCMLEWLHIARCLAVSKIGTEHPHIRPISWVGSYWLLPQKVLLLFGIHKLLIRVIFSVGSRERQFLHILACGLHLSVWLILLEHIWLADVSFTLEIHSMILWLLHPHLLHMSVIGVHHLVLHMTIVFLRLIAIDW